VLLYYIGITKPANPVKIWGILWLFISVLLYYIGITKPAKAGAENYAITFGGICFFISFAHLMRVTRDWFTSRFPKISAYVYRDRATPFFAGAICILAVVPFLLIAKMDIIAEHAAIIVYYSLVMGVILVFLEIKKADANKQDNDSPHDGKKC
jgi:signal transduction histidine kinase